MEMWEILVPTQSNEGKPYHTRYHRVWDDKVMRLTSGMTIVPPIRGKWYDGNGGTYSERNIPVRIACTREQIKQIMKFTKVYYDQIDIMAYKVSDEVLFLSQMEH